MLQVQFLRKATEFATILRKLFEWNNCCGLRSISVLLVSLFIVANLVILLHRHEAEISVGEDTESFYGPNQCDFCDYCFHKNGNDLIEHFICFRDVVKITISFSIFGFILASYKFTPQGFTNKGPPVFVA